MLSALLLSMAAPPVTSSKLWLIAYFTVNKHIAIVSDC